MEGMHSTKHDFGKFVAERRRSVGLTQRELARQLHVTESAVSKWERGLSYPDITSVPALAKVLGVSSDELISASENREERHDRRDAKVYRRWRAALLWTTALAYGAAIITSFIVNLSVEHTLSWFWVVLTAVALAFTLTTLPLLGIARRGWVTLASATFWLFALLGVVALLYGAGPWLPISIAAVALTIVICFGPILLRVAPLPAGLRPHVMVLALAIDTIAIAAFLAVTLAALGMPELWLSPALVIAAIGLVPVWIIALVIRYLPGPGLYGAAVAVFVAAVASITVDPLIARVLGEDSAATAVDLSTWNVETINGNVRLLVFVGLCVVAVALAAGGFVLDLRRRSAQRGKTARPNAAADSAEKNQPND